MDYTEYKYLPDGTYHLSRVTGKVEDYGAKWSFGYIVGKGPMTRQPLHGELFGVWTDPEDGTLYVNFVEHTSSRWYALKLAAERGEKAIYDLRERTVIYR